MGAAGGVFPFGAGDEGVDAIGHANGIIRDLVLLAPSDLKENIVFAETVNPMRQPNLRLRRPQPPDLALAPVYSLPRRWIPSDRI